MSVCWKARKLLIVGCSVSECSKFDVSVWVITWCVPLAAARLTYGPPNTPEPSYSRTLVEVPCGRQWIFLGGISTAPFLFLEACTNLLHQDGLSAMPLFLALTSFMLLALPHN